MPNSESEDLRHKGLRLSIEPTFIECTLHWVLGWDGIIHSELMDASSRKHLHSAASPP